MMTPKEDPRAAIVQLVVRLRATPVAERGAVVRQLLPLLADRRVPLAVRFAAAGRALDSLPDTARDIRPVIRALTANVVPHRGLARLRHLQSHTESCDSLDQLIEQRDAKIRFTCPRCHVRLSRAEMAKHLWHEHQLTLVKGKTRSRVRTLHLLRKQHATTGDPAFIDRAAAIGGELAVRAWVAETATPSEAVPLCEAARQRGAGLCPQCFGDVVPRVPALPPLLALANGRLAGDEYIVTAHGVFNRRVSATLAAAVTLLLAVAVVPVLVAWVLAFVAYAFVFVLRTPKVSLDDLAIDAAWRKFGDKLADRRSATRFLTRLCLTSLGRGDPFEHANSLNAIVARAEANEDEPELLAVAQVLQIEDAAQYGRDRVDGIAELVSPAFREESQIAFAEQTLAAYLQLPREATELARLRLVLLSRAFAAEATARELLALWLAAPHFAAVMQVPPHHLAQLLGVWHNRATRPWEELGTARTIFAFCENNPNTASKLLTQEPTALLVCSDFAETELGLLVVSVNGVTLGTITVSDPAMEVRLTASGYELVIGSQSLRLTHSASEDLPAKLKAWFRFRAETLAAFPAMYLRDESHSALRYLSPFVVACPTCGTECIPRIGEIAPAVRS